MKIDSTISGIHSRSEDTVRVSRDYDRGRTSEKELLRVFEKDSADLVELEESCGITLVSDGQLKWQDLIRPFSESLRGLESGADLSRWFDTNSFYRKPTVTGEIAFPKKGFPIQKYEAITPFIKSSGKGNRTAKKFKRKISIPGPYTLSNLVENKYYKSKADLIDAFASALRKVVDDLSKNGFETIQINEPSLVFRYGVSALNNRQDLDSFLSSFANHLSGSSANLILHTYFGDCSKILGKILGLEGIRAIGIDFTQTSLSEIEDSEFGDKALACGCVDGRNSLVESAEWISDYCEDAVRTLKPNGLIVLPSSELKYLPRIHADEKIRSIGKAASLLEKRLQ